MFNLKEKAIFNFIFFLCRKMICLLYMMTNKQEKQLFLNIIYAVSINNTYFLKNNF